MAFAAAGMTCGALAPRAVAGRPSRIHPFGEQASGAMRGEEGIETDRRDRTALICVAAPRGEGAARRQRHQVGWLALDGLKPAALNVTPWLTGRCEQRLGIRMARICRHGVRR